MQGVIFAYPHVMFFDNWHSLIRIAIVGTLAYLTLILVLRTSGKRTLSKMSAFDLVVTVALGSTFATVILNKDIALAEGALAFALLAALQFASSWIMVRYKKVENILKSEPTLLMYKGAYLETVMRKVRITKSEVLAAIRQHGTTTENVQAVVLETDGSLSIVTSSGDKALENLLSDVKPEKPSPSIDSTKPKEG